jgi:outer membrane protein assembly factor BamB
LTVIPVFAITVVFMRWILCLLVVPLYAVGENWPGWRGPTGQGLSRETGLPLHWSADSNIVWKTEIPGESWSSPIVWGERVFVTTTMQGGARCHVLSLDRRTGKVLWNKEMFEQIPLRKEGKNSHATSTPCTDGERVYAVFGDGSIVAVTFDGSIAWTNRQVQFYSRHGLGASPLLHGGLLIMPFDGSARVNAPGQYPNNTPEERAGWQLPWDKSFIAALDTKTGKRVWTAKRGMSRIAHATPVILRSGGKEQLLSIAGDAVQVFDLKNGERLWSVYCQGEGLVPTPVFNDELVFAASGFEKTTLRGIRHTGAFEDPQQRIAWEQRKGVPSQSSLLYIAPHVYAITDGGIASCYDAANGDILWQERVGGNHSASPIHAEGRIYFLSEQGESVVIAAGPEFKVLAKNNIGEKCQASYAASQKQLFIRSASKLFCIGARSHSTAANN